MTEQERKDMQAARADGLGTLMMWMLGGYALVIGSINAYAIVTKTTVKETTVVREYYCLEKPDEKEKTLGQM